MSSSIQSIGIIGLGSMGHLVSALVPKHLVVAGYDTRQITSDISRADLAAVAQTDVVVLAVPLEAYEELLPQVQTYLWPDTLIVDICSVKVEAERLLKRYLPDHPNILTTHPLFGPETAAPGKTAGYDLIVTTSRGQKAKVVLEFCEQTLGLNIHHMSPAEHDRAMAQIHVLTFFVARGLANMHVDKTPFKTPSFQMLLDLVALDKKHSEELFRTIQLGNPFGDEVRRRFIDNLEKLETELTPLKEMA